MKTVAVLALLAAGCTTPLHYSDAPMEPMDKAADYAIEDRSDGFSITVNYSRYQMFPESDSVATACRAALTSKAWDAADQRKRKIEPINEQRIKLSMGRNGLTGMTTCSANAVVSWAK